MNKLRVLVFPGTTEIGLEIWRSLKDCKDIILYSAASVYNHAPYVFKNHFIIPEISSNGWIGSLNNVLEKHNIDYIFPAYDDVIVALAENRDKLSAQVVTSPRSTCLVTRSKSQTYERFKDLIPVPRLFHDIAEILAFPVFVKPDKGQGSHNAYRIDDADTLQRLSNPDLIVLEYLSGKEYTVDCLTDREKGLLFCSGRERLRTRSGISMNSRPADSELQELFRGYADIISGELEFHGAWFFQVKQDADGNFKLLEIAPRISGAMATHRVLGVNFPLLSIYEQERVDFEIMTNNLEVELDRSLANRYKLNIDYDKVYVDLDDTIIVNDKLNAQLMCFLYQAINQGCRIVLLTRTLSDVDCVLERWRLKSCFDEVILLGKKEAKSDFINPEKAIFIDDSFSERKDVFDKHRIPTFDCSMIEALINEQT